MKDEAGDSNLKIRAYQVHPVSTARTWFFPGAFATANLPTAVLRCNGTYQNVFRVYVTSQQACLRNVEAFCAKVGKSAQAPVRFVKVRQIEYRFGEGSWSGVPNPLYVPVGSNVHFRALPEPAPDWPSGKPTWAGATAGTGGTAVAVFHQPGSNTVLAECGNTVTARVTALKVDIQQTEQYVCQQASNIVLNLTGDSFWSTGTVNWHSQPSEK
ncbi:MAG: hypothetical protein ACOYCD_02485 [Kiritimatiellia bacterium]|jgi:hypothetical protein